MTRRSRNQLDDDGRQLVAWLHERFTARPNYGYSVDTMAQAMGWTYNKTISTIHHIRNRMFGPRYQIYCFKKGRSWYYKIPTEQNASRYEEVRGYDIAVRSANVLVQVRKRAELFGVTRDTDRRTTAYTEILRWLTTAGVEDAEGLLHEALRPLDLNGQIAS